ncbi:MAG: hypothetical protein ACQEXX_18880 [Bacillota bacterium]
MKVSKGQTNRLRLHSGSKKSSPRARRGLTFTRTKRRFDMKFGQRKRRGAKGRYRIRQETRRRRSISPERPLVLNQGYDQAYNDDFKAGFAQGYEDGHFAASTSSLPYRRSNVK